MILNEWCFIACFWIATKVVYLQHCLIVRWLVPRETGAISVCSVYIVQPCTISCPFMQSHICRVHACLAVTCHLHFWQNNWDHLGATVVMGGGGGGEGDGYWNKSPDRKLTMGKKIVPPLLPGLEPGTFQSQVRGFDCWAIPAPHGHHAADQLCSCVCLCITETVPWVPVQFPVVQHQCVHRERSGGLRLPQHWRLPWRHRAVPCVSGPASPQSSFLYTLCHLFSHCMLFATLA